MQCDAQFRWSYNSGPNTIGFRCRRELHEHRNCVHHCIDVLHSSDSHAILSCIKILWYLGRNCMTVGAQHYIETETVPTCIESVGNISVMHCCGFLLVYGTGCPTANSTGCRFFYWSYPYSWMSDYQDLKTEVAPFSVVCVWVVVLAVSMEMHMLWLFPDNTRVHK